MRDYELKDLLLQYSNETDTNKSASSFSCKYKIDFSEVIIRCKELERSEYLECIRMPPSEVEFRGDLLFMLTPQGRFLLNNGGFTKVHNAEIRKKRLTISKEVMTYISTVAIIIIAWLNYLATDKANDNQREELRLNNIIDSQMTVIDSLISDTCR